MPTTNDKIAVARADNARLRGAFEAALAAADNNRDNWDAVASRCPAVRDALAAWREASAALMHLYFPYGY